MNSCENVQKSGMNYFIHHASIHHTSYIIDSMCVCVLQEHTSHTVKTPGCTVVDSNVWAAQEGPSCCKRGTSSPNATS